MRIRLKKISPFDQSLIGEIDKILRKSNMFMIKFKVAVWLDSLIMILPNNIFLTLEDCLKFLLYIRSKKQFNVEELSNTFDISRWAIYKHIKTWENQKLILKKSSTAEKGGKQHQYSISKKARMKLDKI